MSQSKTVRTQGSKFLKVRKLVFHIANIIIAIKSLVAKMPFFKQKTLRLPRKLLSFKKKTTCQIISLCKVWWLLSFQKDCLSFRGSRFLLRMNIRVKNYSMKQGFLGKWPIYFPKASCLAWQILPFLLWITNILKHGLLVLDFSSFLSDLKCQALFIMIEPTLCSVIFTGGEPSIR